MLRIGKLSMHVKLVILVLCFVCIPFLVSGVFWYEQSTRVIENNVIRYSQQSVKQINKNLDSYFVELDTITSPVLTSPLVSQFLEMKDADPYDEYLIKRKIENELFLNILSVRTDIINISVVTEDGKVVSSFEDRSALSAYQLYKGKEPSAGTFKNFNIAGIRKLNSSPVLTITRDMMDLSKNRYKAMLIIDLNYYKTIPGMLENVKLGRNDFIWAADPDGNIVYHPDEQYWGKAAVEVIPHASIQKENGNGYYIDNSSGTKKLVIYDYLNTTGWMLVDELPLRELIGSLMNLRYLTMVIGFVLIVLVVTVMGTFTVSLTRSLLLLQRLMRKAEAGNLDVRAPGHRGREIGSLYRSFNAMVSEIKRLIEVVHTSELRQKEMEIKQMESSLLIMQSQINPHFLYNTLEVVNSYAIEAGAKSISQMVASIAKMFRYNIGNPQKTVTLHEEMQYIRTYLTIQKERYKGLTIEWDVDETESKLVSTVRLILQPIVENAFHHGYEDHDLKPEYVSLSGRFAGQGYILTISDKGKGMPADTISRMNRLFTEIPLYQMVRQQLQERNLGLWNVHSRLRLTFGEPYGVYIQESGPEGTKIEITLPGRKQHV